METHSSLRVFGWCGLASVLVDLDHAYSYVLYKTIYPTLAEGRILHPLIFLTICLLLGYMGAHLGRLYFKLVLRRKK